MVDRPGCRLQILLAGCGHQAGGPGRSVAAATPAEKLKAVQDLVQAGDERAMQIFTDIGCYLAHTIELYAHFYDISYLIVLGRVMSGRGGELILAQCQRVLQEEYPALAASVHVMLPDEKTRRVGQSVAAASLPECKRS